MGGKFSKKYDACVISRVNIKNGYFVYELDKYKNGEFKYTNGYYHEMDIIDLDINKKTDSQECHICYENKQWFFNSYCKCNINVCSKCKSKIEQVNDIGYNCPLCKQLQPISSRVIKKYIRTKHRKYFHK